MLHYVTIKDLFGGARPNLFVPLTFLLFRGTKTLVEYGMAECFLLPLSFSVGRGGGIKIGTAGITKAKECAELVLLGKWERRREEGRREERRCRDGIAFAHHREGNGISELDNGLVAQRGC